MKFEAKQKYINISLCAFGVTAASIVLYMLLQHFTFFTGFLGNIMNILSPFVWGFALAYILNYPYRWFVKKFSSLKKKPREGFIKAISMVITYLLFIIIAGTFIYFIAPQIINAIIGFADVIPTYVTKIRVGTFDILADYLKRYDVSQDEVYNIMNTMFEDFTANLDLQHIMVKIVDLLISVSVGLKNFIIGLIVSVYFLFDKERFKRAGKKLVYAVSSKETARRILYILGLTDRTFGSFVIANVLDSVIIGCICYIGMALMKLEYPVLIAVIVGVTNIIPFFGPFIGAIPSNC